MVNFLAAPCLLATRRLALVAITASTIGLALGAPAPIGAAASLDMTGSDVASRVTDSVTSDVTQVRSAASSPVAAIADFSQPADVRRFDIMLAARQSAAASTPSATSGSVATSVRTAQSVSTVSVSPTPSQATTTTSSVYRKDLYFSAGYERQIDGRTCTAASTAMMMNFIARKDLKLSQMRVLRYEQPRDALNDNIQRGSDPLGWSKAATRFSKRADKPTTYTWKAYASKAAALKAAAKAIARYGKPVGIVAWSGRHAIVMTGFKANRNPNEGRFTLRTVYTSDPYWSGPTVGRHRKWSARGFAFSRYGETDATPKYDKLWIGKYIIIVPTN